MKWYQISSLQLYNCGHAIQGAQDKLVNPDGAKFLYQSVSSEDKKLFVVKGAFHNLFVELDEVKIPVIKTTVDWILEHV